MNCLKSKVEQSKAIELCGSFVYRSEAVDRLLKQP